VSGAPLKLQELFPTHLILKNFYHCQTNSFLSNYKYVIYTTHFDLSNVSYFITSVKTDTEQQLCTGCCSFPIPYS